MSTSTSSTSRRSARSAAPSESTTSSSPMARTTAGLTFSFPCSNTPLTCLRNSTMTDRLPSPLSLNKNIESHRVAIEKLRKFDAVVLDKVREHAPEWLSKGTVVDDSWIASTVHTLHEDQDERRGPNRGTLLQHQGQVACQGRQDHHREHRHEGQRGRPAHIPDEALLRPSHSKAIPPLVPGVWEGRHHLGGEASIHLSRSTHPNPTSCLAKVRADD